MSITFGPDDIARVATLARLGVSAEETVRLAGQLHDILEYAATIQAVDTTGVTPMVSAQAHETSLRDDIPHASLPRDAVLALAPAAARDAGLFRVPKVIG